MLTEKDSVVAFQDSYIGFTSTGDSNREGVQDMRAIPIENHYTIKELEYFARKCKDHRVERKARAIIMALLGFSRTVAARSQGVGTQTVRDWVLAYNAEGLDGLQPAPNQGRPSRLSEDDRKTIVHKVLDGPPEDTSSPSKWNVCGIADMIFDLSGIRYTLEGVRKLLHRCGLRWISPRPIHPKADLEAQETFRRDFQDLVHDLVGPLKKRKLQFWFQDEARMGQMGLLRHLWARKGTRPQVKRDCRFKSCVLFSAACPEYHLSAAHITDQSNTDEMNELLVAISAEVQEGYHAVVILDRATWHRSRDLVIPSNVSLLHLPPYSPELNPMETVYNHLKSNFHANRVFETIDDLKANTQRAWQAFADDPDLMKSIMHRKWVIAPDVSEPTSVIR